MASYFQVNFNQNEFEWIKTKFLALWLSDFTNRIYPTFLTTVGEFPTPEEIISHLNKGSAILVPYDCDKNFEPCNRGGHAAHWAVIVGYL